MLAEFCEYLKQEKTLADIPLAKPEHVHLGPCV
jgi:hypothetical protein